MVERVLEVRCPSLWSSMMGTWREGFLQMTLKDT
jgi:hypothetical protein